MSRRKLLPALLAPGAVSEHAALAGGLFALLAMAGIDAMVGVQIRLHILYLLPVAWVALHCAANSRVTVVASLAVLLQLLVLFNYPGSMGVRTVSWAVASLVLVLVVVLVRVARKMYLELAYLASHDLLTRVHNRHSLEGFLEAEIARQARYGGTFSAVMIDMDRFKELNDTQGHQSGDRALTMVGAILRAESRASDLVARLGGDEFFVLLPNASSSDCAQYCEQILTRIRSEMRRAGFEVTASIGAATFDAAPSGVREVLARVDGALYEAKRAGRNRVVAV